MTTTRRGIAVAAAAVMLGGVFGVGAEASAASGSPTASTLRPATTYPVAALASTSLQLAGWTTDDTVVLPGTKLVRRVQVSKPGYWRLVLQRRVDGTSVWKKAKEVITFGNGRATVRFTVKSGTWNYRLLAFRKAAPAGAKAKIITSPLIARGDRLDCYWAPRNVLRPPSNTGTGKRVVWDQSARQIWLVQEDGQVACSYLVTGNISKVPVGVHSVASKSVMSTALTTSGDVLYLGYMTRFYRRDGHALWIGFHEVPKYSNGAYIMPLDRVGYDPYISHGCVREHPTNARAMWAFAPVGTPVHVVA